MEHGTERNRKRWEALTPEQKAAVERIRTKHQTPEYRAEEEVVREAVRLEFPPAHADAGLSALMEMLRAERERQGLSLSDITERSGIDKATLSKLETGKMANPTFQTIRTYAAALGKRARWVLEDAGVS